MSTCLKTNLRSSLLVLSLLVIAAFAQAQVPGAPTNLVVTPMNLGGKVAFTAPSSIGGSAITNYQYSTDNGTTWVTPSPAVTASPLITSSSLSNCTVYQINIRAVNNSGSGTASAGATLVPTVSITYSDVVNWISRASAADNDWSSITYGNGLFVAVASSGTDNRVMTSPDGITWTARTSAADYNWCSVTYGNGLFVAVAGNAVNGVMTSPDGINWTEQISATELNWKSVTYGNGLFVAVAGDGTGNRVMTSPNGINWTAQSSAADNFWTSVTYGNGLFVAVASNELGNCVMTSPDGINWTAQYTAMMDPNDEWQSVTYGNGLFVAVGVNYLDGVTGENIMTSPDGINWTAQYFSWVDYYWKSVTYGNGLFVAIGDNNVMTSPDGITWTWRTSAASGALSGVTYGNGIFAAVAQSGTGNRVMTSSDTTYTAANAPVIVSIAGLSSSARVAFTQPASAYAPAISNYEYSTNNGSTWTARNPASTLSPITITGLTNGTTYNIKIRAVNTVGASCASNGMQVTPAAISTANAPTNLVATPLNTGGMIQFTPPANAASADIVNYQYSTDNGSSWVTPSPAVTESPVIISSGLTNCTTYQIKIRAVSYSGTFGTASVTANLTPTASTDERGTTWRSRSLYTYPSRLTSVTYGNGLFVAVSSAKICTSNDGVNWSSSTSAVTTNNLWQSVTYGNGLFVAVSNKYLTNNGGVMTSPDGVTWTSRTPASNKSWLSVTYGNGLFVAVDSSRGVNNGVMTSPNGITWTSRTPAVGNSWRSVTYGNGLFVAVAASGVGNRVMTSPDGVNWSSRASSADINWSSVTYGNGLFVAVAYDTTINNRVMTSPDGIIWTSRTPAANSNWASVTYGNGLFVAVANWRYSIGYSFEYENSDWLLDRVMTSPDGINWTKRTLDGNKNLVSVTYGNGLFVSVASHGPVGQGSYARVGMAMSSSFSVAADAPVITSITPRNNAVSVAFTQTASAYAPAVSNYEYSTDNGNTWTARYPASYLSPMTITGLTNGTSYNIKIRAINAIGNSCISSAVSTTPAQGVVAGAPTNLLVTSINTGAMIHFTAPQNDGGSFITNYQYSTDNGANWITPSPAVTESPLVISSGLTNCTTYSLQLRAVNAAGSGAASAAANATPIASIDERGTIWRERDVNSSSFIPYNVAFGNGLFVMGALNKNHVMTSTDGVNWTDRTATGVPNGFSVESIAYGNGIFVVIGRTTTDSIIFTSTDGVNWTNRPSLDMAGLTPFLHLTYGNGLFVATSSAYGVGNRVITSPDGINWSLRITSEDHMWRSTAFGNGIFVTVAQSGTGRRVMTSPDGINWTVRSSAADNSWSSVTYGNGLFVAVASSGTGNRVMTSPDGITWTIRTSAADKSWTNVTYGNGLFVAVSEDLTNNLVMTSPNGINWTSVSGVNNSDWDRLVYGNGVFVAVGSGGTGKHVMTSSYAVAADAPLITSITPRNTAAIVAFTQTVSAYAPAVSNYEYSTDNGNTWTARNPASTSSPMIIAGLTNGTIYSIKIRSINTVGISCASSAVSATPVLGTVADAPTILVITPINTGGIIQFIAPANDGGSDITNYEYSTDNGATWVTPSPSVTESPLTISSGLNNCTLYAIKLRAVNAAGSGAASVAENLTPNQSVNQVGVNWTIRTSAANNRWYGLTYGNGLFVSVANNGTGNAVMTSPDGVTWTSRTSAADNQWLSVTYGNGLFVAVAQSGTGNRVMTSPDGITWTSRNSAANNNWQSVTYGNGLFVSVANSGTGNRVMTSPDGITWTARTSAADNGWTCVTFGNGLFVAVAYSGTGNRVMTSSDGINWTIRTSALNNDWYSVTYGNGLFVAVAATGSGNRVMTSSNGISWTIRTSAVENTWSSVTYGSGLFVAVANSGVTGNLVMTSPDGINWSTRSSAADNGWNCVTFGNGLFVAAAGSGTGNRVMTSSLSYVADAPVITSATFSSSTTVNFTQTSSVLAPSITNYEYSTNNGNSWTVVSPAATTSPLTITGLASVPTSVLIRAVNSVGSSCPSNLYGTTCTPTSSTETISACDSYTWHDTLYTASNNTATWTGTNAGGCDSVVTLHLTINSSNTGSSSATACNTYTWSGSTYTTSGSYTKTLTNAASCDSVHTMSLTINYSSSSSVTVSQLGCYTWALNAVTYTVSGNYSLTYTNAIGCDSIVTLYLTITPGVYLNAKAILSGPYVTAAALMHDSLRVNGFIPTTEPYTSSPYNKTAIGGSSGETVSNAILNVSGNNAIVDWVFIELRDAASNGTVVANKRALIQRDGDIVSNTDGTSPVYFPTVANGNYYVSIKHRNHLGVMSLNAISFSGCSTRSIDFTTSDPVYTMLCANPAQRKQIGSVYALWAGDANNNKNVKYNGLSNDKDALIYVLGISTPNNTVSRVYRMEDVNLDGKIRYNNTDNDRVIILNNVGVSTPNNVYFQHTPN